jgi:hypothetical protein
MTLGGSNSDSVAQDQIRAFIAGANRLDVAGPAQLAEAIAGREPRHQYALRELLGFDRHAPLPILRARAAAASLLGCSSDVVLHRCAVWQRRGGLNEAIASLESWMPAPVWEVEAIPPELIGFVYGMAAPDYPGICKVGFSTDPERRLAELQRQHNVALELVCAVPGTRLDESLVHFQMRDFALANEWFDLDGRWKSEHPLSFIFTPSRMWREIGEGE